MTPSNYTAVMPRTDIWLVRSKDQAYHVVVDATESSYVRLWLATGLFLLTPLSSPPIGEWTRLIGLPPVLGVLRAADTAGPGPAYPTTI
jgi:hypothetical protein